MIRLGIMIYRIVSYEYILLSSKAGEIEGVALSIYLNPLSSVLVMGRQIVRLRYMLYD